MASKEDYIVDGFEFETEVEAKAARNDGEKIRKLDSKLNYNNSEAVLMVYDKAIENHVFETVVGDVYLKKLQEHLIEQKEESGNIVLKPVPVHSRLSFQKKKQEAEQVKVRISSRKEVKEKLRYSVMLNFLLAVIIVILFIITLTGENANIINYKTAITNQYAQWEQDLKEREEVIREKEKELSIE